MIASTAHRVVPREGEQVAGDAVLVRAIEGGGALVAVIDGLGHGPEAAAVAETSTRWLAAVSIDATVLEMTEGVHAALRGTRGAAGMICVLRGGAIEGCGVGNVELRSARGKIPVVLSPGVLGGHLRKLRVFRAPLVPHDRLAIFTDGLATRLDLGLARELGTNDACELLFDRFRRSHDDAGLLLIDLAD